MHYSWAPFVDQFTNTCTWLKNWMKIGIHVTGSNVQENLTWDTVTITQPKDWNDMRKTTY